MPGTATMTTSIPEAPVLRLRTKSDAPRKQPAHDLYQPLPHPDSIRLLEIHPGPHSAPLACHLVLSRLNPSTPPPSYEAISYVWGSVSARTSLHCNAHALSVTQNLGDALKRFRLPTAPRVVWVDGLCINQADDREKGHQVKRMRLIYKRAARVLVWLGHPPDAAMPRKAFSAICALANQRQPRDGAAAATWSAADDDDEDGDDSTEPSSSLLPPPPPSPSTSTEHDRPPTGRRGAHARRHAALAPFYGLPWFRRTWVIQEIALARSATLHWGGGGCGSGGASIAWPAVARATDRIIERKARLAPLHALPGVENAHLMGSLWWAERAAAARTGADARMSFAELFVKTSKLFLVSDPRDKVYGLLGIPTRDADPDEGVLYLEPDYEVGVVGLYVRLFQRHGVRMEELR
ncbi:putative het domain-containing protein [Neofusicoccum parvum UCRNP2]|uniref:Putative het domain-containing protein n=1 Tax=Botryosphaeria parva (strain UCR-NP2) TaxID=1287680 RepID=R1GDZ1_BOTPV|nr:putative het domain-containing protein [Neofusicoccum parvum UCRNP2]